ncbi:MAG: hypothetical protein LBC69_02175 [Eubacteriaceae bacterium]|jgi:stage III sporulation protein AG|nr:hypothetical protein [Eubacteriaceae bacterium]
MSGGFWGRQADFYKKLKTKDKIALLVALALCSFLAISLSDTLAKPKEKSQASAMTTKQYQEDLENRIASFLSNIQGAGKVDVIITLDGEMAKDIAYNETSTQSSSTDAYSRVSEQATTTREVVLERDGTASSPYIITDKYPKAIGAIVAAQGASDPIICEYITDAVMASLNVPAHRIKVLPRN